MNNFGKWLNLVDTKTRAGARSWRYGLLVAPFLAASPVFATGGGDPDPGLAQDQEQHQGQDQAQTQETTVITEASIAEGAVQITNAAAPVQGSYTVKLRNNPNVYAPPIQPTIPCYKTGGGGASGGGLGLSFGGGKIDSNCVEREEIRLGHALGHTAIALFRYCSLENNVLAFGSAEACMGYDSSPTSTEYQLLLREKERIERELIERTELLVAQCAAAKERGDRLEEDWLECLEK